MWSEERYTKLYTAISIQSANSVGKYGVYVISYLPLHEHLLTVYIKRTKALQLGSMFICNCNIALYVSGAFCVHLQEHLETVEAASGE